MVDELPPPVVARLARLYPYFTDTELAEILELPVWLVKRYAKRLQLRKYPVHMRARNHNGNRTLRVEKPNMGNILFVARKILEMYDGEIKKGSVFYLKGNAFVNRFYGRKIGKRKRNPPIDARNVFNYAIRYLRAFGIAKKWSGGAPRYRGHVWKINMWKLKKFVEKYQTGA